MAKKPKTRDERSSHRPLQVVYDADASRELADVADQSERFAIFTAIDKLRAVGPMLPFPHSSAIKGSNHGVRELRPRAGKSAYRPLYRRFGDFLVILAIGHKADFAKQVGVADERATRYS